MLSKLKKVLNEEKKKAELSSDAGPKFSIPTPQDVIEFLDLHHNNVKDMHEEWATAKFELEHWLKETSVNFRFVTSADWQHKVRHIVKMIGYAAQQEKTFTGVVNQNISGRQKKLYIHSMFVAYKELRTASDSFKKFRL